MESSSVGTRDDNFSKASMSVVELNNYIVSMRPVVKRAKQQTIQKIVKQIKQYRNKKGTEEQQAANNKKADRLLLEIKIVKRVDVDRATKYSLGNVLTFEQAAKKGNPLEKVLTRIACNKLVKTKISSWRQEHEDWESLAAFAVSKNTGRRYKKKKSKVPELVGLTSHTDATADEKSDSDGDVDESGSWHSEDEDVDTTSVGRDLLSEENEFTSFSLEISAKSKSDVKKASPSSKVAAKSDIKIPSSSSEIAAKSKNDSKKLVADHQQINRTAISSVVNTTAIAATSTLCSSPAPSSRREIVVKQISLDELSDEELFLPPPDEEMADAVVTMPATRHRKTKNSFFVASDDDENDVSDSNDADEEDDTGGTDDRAVRACDIKSSTLFAKSLSKSRTFSRPNCNFRGNSTGRFGQPYKHRSDGFDGRKQKHFDSKDSLHFKGRKFTKTKGSFSDSRRGDKRIQSFGKPRVGKHDRRLSETRPSKFVKLRSKQSDTASNNTFSADKSHAATSSSQNEKLHPSWTASKQRKEREKNAFVFQGTKKTFDDSD